MSEQEKSTLKFSFKTWSWSNVTNPAEWERQKKEFIRQVPKWKAELPQLMAPFLRKAGFIYGKDLYKDFKIETANHAGINSISLTCLIYFEDTENEGKTAFTRRVQKTGLLDHEVYIYKTYGRIY